VTGARVRTDIIEAYVVRAESELLLLRRATEPMQDTWQPVFGHAEGPETGAETARRELREETGLARGAGLAALFAVEGARPFYLPESDEIVLCPRFAALAEPGWEPALSAEHTAARWVRAGDAEAELFWPSQRETWDEIRRCVLDAAGRGATRLDP